MEETGWQKANFSSEKDDCMELGRLNGVIALRESDDPDVILTAPVSSVGVFLAGMKAGKFDHVD
ncbi:DUF397 domain-containing protein [Streptomyces sp. NPDC003077]|uniref:DUF397 domain-containing protein n=1 Tax=Streptomyces sp. NPDC003077 TaxID=3154443 RepID=UPI0033B64624